MTLRRRILHTTVWNLVLILVPISVYHITQAVTMWGALRGYWPLFIAFEG